MNLLQLALGVVGAQPVQWRRNTGRTTNAAGYQEPAYADPAPITGNVQPVPQKMFQLLGLDLNKEYVTLYTPASVVAVGRDGSGDKVVHDGKTYLCESSTPWAAQAGWSAVVAVRVPA